jgi:hypothetical protein
MLTVAEFEDGWKRLIEKYALTKNTFLIQIYEVRKKWAKPYFAGKFCAKQTSTQRSESANHMLKNYVPPACSINVFVKQYRKLQYDREQEEGYQEKRTTLVSSDTQTFGSHSGACFKLEKMHNSLIHSNI